MVFVLLILSSLVDAHASPKVVGACSTSEQWTFTPAISAKWQEEYRAYTTRAKEVFASFPDSFMMAIDAKAKGAEPAATLFAGYWKARLYFDVGLYHMAADALNAVASQPVTDASYGIQLAALECLSRIHHKMPRLGPTPPTLQRLPDLVKRAPGHGAAMEHLVVQMHIALTEKRSATEINQILTMLKGSGAYEFLANAMKEVEQGDPTRSVWYLDRFQQLARTHNRSGQFPPTLRRYVDTTRLLLARSLFKRNEVKKGLEILKAMPRDSNQFVHALAESAWGYLMEGQYREVIGTVMGLQQGGLRTTFNPESVAILAMTLNEVCQYKEALRTIQFYHRKYKPVYQWLKKNGTSFQNPYLAVTQFLETKQSPVPRTILSTWLGSPIFLGMQEELNSLIDERKAFKQLVLVAADYKSEASDAPSGSLRGMGNAAAHKEIQEQHQTFLRNSIYMQRMLVQLMNQDLNLRSRELLKRLSGATESIYLVQIEIYNSASEDVIWKNQHPEFKQYADRFRGERNEEKSVGEFWNWGSSRGLAYEGGEVWEDELGSLSTDHSDQCLAKEKYLEKLQKQSRGR